MELYRGIVVKMVGHTLNSKDRKLLQDLDDKVREVDKRVRRLQKDVWQYLEDLGNGKIKKIKTKT